MLDKDKCSLSIRKQCLLLGVWRSNVYYKPAPKQDEALLANEIYELWHEDPSSGYRKITKGLQRLNYDINHKRVRRIMLSMSIQAIYQKPRMSVSNHEHKKYPYLLKDLPIVRPNQVWCTDITYIKAPGGGFMYLVAIIDVFSRYIVAWRFSNTLDSEFCENMLKDALKRGKPEILNTDQGCQFTSQSWIALVEGNGIKVSMDGKGRWADNIYIERFWRTIKYEHVFLYVFESVSELRDSIAKFMNHYNKKRLHQSLKYKTPEEVYLQLEDVKMPPAALRGASSYSGVNVGSLMGMVC
jgi:putative transposase